MATSKPRLIRNDLVTDANFARFQHASDHDPCPVADKARFLDAMMSLNLSKRKKAPCRGPGSNRSGQVAGAPRRRAAE
jgi:hypothetical protein